MKELPPAVTPNSPIHAAVATTPAEVTFQGESDSHVSGFFFCLTRLSMNKHSVLSPVSERAAILCFIISSTPSDPIMRQYLAHLLNGTCRGKKKSPFKQKLPFHPCSATRSTVPLLPPSRLHQQRLCPSGELKRKEVGQEEGERRCASASGMRREDSAGKYSLMGGCTQRGWTVWKNPLRYCRVLVVVVAVIGGRGFPPLVEEQCGCRAGRRQMLGGERGWERETEEEDRARVTDIPLTPR